jgi:hypothetical protein
VKQTKFELDALTFSEICATISNAKLCFSSTDLSKAQAQESLGDISITTLSVSRFCDQLAESNLLDRYYET